MAGRPKTMVKRVEQFEIAAYELTSRIFQTIPQIYRDDRETKNVIGSTWNETVDAAVTL